MATREQAANPREGTAASDLVLARQPVLDHRLDVLGFELLYRPINGHGRPQDPEHATATVLSAAFSEIGLDTLVGSSLAFVNVTRAFLLEVRPLPLPPERVVLELVEDQVVDAALLEVVHELTQRGFRLALDDFAYRPALEPLVDLATYVKLDVRALDRTEVTAEVERLRDRGVTLVAEKVESQEEFEYCRGLGFDAFQGFFFARPQLVRRQRTPTFRLDTLRTLATTSDDGFEELEELISYDVGLSHKLLRLVNSAHVATRSPVRSVRHALTRLGARTVKRWLLMLALADGRSEFDTLLLTALIRARMCELLAAEGREADGDRAFTVGLFSVADGLVGQPLDELLDALPFDARVVDALVDHDGPEGEILEAVVAYERGYFEVAAGVDRDLGTLARRYYDALEWAYGITLALK